MLKQTQSPLDEVVYAEPSVLDQAIEATQKTLDQKKPLVPAGFNLLKAGIVRQIRVNKNFIVGFQEKAFIVSINGIEVFYDEVLILGQCRMAKNKKEVASGCGYSTVNTAYVETDSALAVK